MSLANEVTLVRAAILYADEIELISASLAVLTSVARQISGGPPMQIRPTLTSADREALHYLIGKGSGAELLAATRAGLLRFAPFSKAFGSFNDPQGGEADSIVENFLIDPIRTRLKDPSTRLLLDDVAGAFTRYLIDEGRIDPSPLAMRHAGEAAVGAGLIGRLPTFPQAPIDELLHLRADLDRPLTRYRAKVSELASTIATGSLDPDYKAEVDDLWTNEVAPAFADLQEGFAEHGLVRELARMLGKDVKSVISGVAAGIGITIGLNTLTTVSQWISIAAGVAAPVTQAAATALTAARDGRLELQRHELFFLYETERRLGAAHRASERT